MEELLLPEVLNRLQQTQKDRIKKIKDRNWTQGKFHETNNMDFTHLLTTFCLTLDNYFMLPKVILALREQGVGIAGTGRAQKIGHLKNWKSITE